MSRGKGLLSLLDSITVEGEVITWLHVLLLNVLTFERREFASMFRRYTLLLAPEKLGAILSVFNVKLLLFC